MFKRWSAAVLAAALLFTVPACGNEADRDGNGTPDRTELEQLISEASEVAKQEKSARSYMRMTGQIPAEQGGGTIITEGTGVFQFDPPLGRMTQTFEGEGGTAPQAAQLLGKQEIVMEGLTVYMRSDFFQQQLQTDKEWLKMDLQAIGEQLGLDFNQLMQTAQGDPASQLDYLTGATEVEKLGTEAVRGVETTHYSGVIDFELMKEQSGDAGGSIDRLIELSGTSEVPFEVWLDEQGRPARYSMDVDYSNSEMPATAAMGKTSMTFEYFDWGVPVKVEVPEETDTLDMLEFLQEQQTSTG